ncbi:Cytidine deaminase [Candidatus Izimaplasma bacterium HR1]|jgi:cytidine deaminase|uniref:cytidine deaminase n=1 Tax=Candidatus Izimoplasma sp. HR1 TaxID=1541959 RepID=UPI0004F837DB|nr:Cytidine deaminase [Candidatus Izimaplasma bacterium HR1]
MKDLYKIAKGVLPNSYSQYSNFKVAAALRLKNGEIITGVNVENASFGLTNCAERSALFTAYSQGYRKEDIDEILITTEQEDFISPCGACRQVMRELMPDDAKVHFSTVNGETKTVLNKDLLPFAFTEKDL